MPKKQRHSHGPQDFAEYITPEKAYEDHCAINDPPVWRITMLEPEYLGDGVYAQQSEAFPLILSTGSHHCYREKVVIYFEPEVLLKLMYYINKIKENCNGLSNPKP